MYDVITLSHTSSNRLLTLLAKALGYEGTPEGVGLHLGYRGLLL